MLDTNIASAIINQNKMVLEKITAMPNHWLSISAITAAELKFGGARRPEATNLRKRIQTFLMGMNILPFSDEDATAYAQLKALASSSGRSLSDMDMLIAAQAFSRQLILVTADRAFSHIHQLSIENWLTP